MSDQITTIVFNNDSLPRTSMTGVTSYTVNGTVTVDFTTHTFSASLNATTPTGALSRFDVTNSPFNDNGSSFHLILFSGVSGQMDLISTFNNAYDYQAPPKVDLSINFNNTPTTSYENAAAPVTSTVNCFAADTMIATDHGEVAVQFLRPGDLVRVIDLHGSATAAPVLWIGRSFIACHAHPAPRRVQPIRVRAGAFGAGRPLRDLLLSPEHAVRVGDVLVPVGLLENGDTVASVDVPTVSYFHILLEHHAIVLAEGLPCETLLDLEAAEKFDNASYMPSALGPLTPCLPRVTQGARLAAAQRALRELHVV